MKFNLRNEGWSFPACNYCKRRTEEVNAVKCNKYNTPNQQPTLR